MAPLRAASAILDEKEREEEVEIQVLSGEIAAPRSIKQQRSVQHKSSKTVSGVFSLFTQQALTLGHSAGKYSGNSNYSVNFRFWFRFTIHYITAQLPCYHSTRTDQAPRA